ncbi:DUF202 domain-containing protein [Citrobacter sp. JGM124]|uniref:YidH family protein n=1 Tax=Citrobacter sp. JGM124 TaxID=2799789 RepID=UPI0032C42FA5
MNHQDNTRSMPPEKKWWQEGKTPDYRFTLANERTFLAWVRTSLAFMAGAVGIEQFTPQASPPELKIALVLILLAVGASMGFLAWRRWRRNEYAMRMEQDLPYTRSVPFLGGFVVVLAFLLGFLLWLG